MNPPIEPHILIIDESIVESTILMTLLSPLSKKIVICSNHNQGLEILTNLRDKNAGPDLIFLTLPPDHHHDFEVAIKLFALALQNGNPSRTIVLGGDKLPPQFDGEKTKDSSFLQKPITREKLEDVLATINYSFPKNNCWEYMGCGREPGGENASESGVCPAAIEMAAEGIHSGKRGGRACWAVSGTMCGGTVQGTFANKISNCHSCDFYQLIKLEEGHVFESVNSILGRLQRGKRK